MKKYQSIYVFILLGLLILMGCTPKTITDNKTADKPSWTEQQVIEMLYDNVISKAGKEPSKKLESTKVLFTIGFANCIRGATSQVIEKGKLSDGWGEPVKVFLDSKSSIMTTPDTVDTFTNALNILAKYRGHGLWEVSMGNDEWNINEVTHDVTAINDSAQNILNEISHDYYQNRTYNYEIRYPVSWQVIEQPSNSGKVSFTELNAKARLLIITQQSIPGENLSSLVSMFPSELASTYKYYNLLGVTKLANGDYAVDWECQLDNSWMYNKMYFLSRNNYIHSICGTVSKDQMGLFVKEFDYSYYNISFN